MNGMIVIAACLVLIDRVCFRGQLVSLLVESTRNILHRSRKSTHEEPPPVPAMPPAELPIIIHKHYMIGLDASETATPPKVEQPVNRDVIFAAPQNGAMMSWAEMEAWKLQTEEREAVEVHPPQAIPNPAEPSGKISPYDDLPEDVTQEEREEVRHFDLNAFREPIVNP